jgi:Zn-dependent protease/CBS domain-containing protein
VNGKYHPESEQARRGVPGSRGVRLGRIAGITVTLDFSLLIIFALITLTLAGGLLPYWHPEWGMGAILITAVSAALLFLASILAHELAHAIVGRRLGVHVERITLFVFGGMAHMENEPRTWRAELGMALAGPVTSVVLGLVFLHVAGLISGPIAIDPDDPIQAISKLSPVATVLFWLGPVNILLGLFNMIPGFPLDGGRVLRAILWGISGDLQRATCWAAASGQAFAWLLIGVGFAMILGARVPFFGAGPVAGLWIALIGWFLNSAAVSSYQRVVVQATLGDVPVSRVMLSDYVEVAPDIRVRTFVDELLLRSSQRAFPVIEEGELRGLVCLEDVRKLDPERRGVTPVSDIMTAVERLHTVSPSQKATDALNLLAEHRVNQLPVVDNGRFLGMVTREGILKWLSLRRIPLHGGSNR